MTMTRERFAAIVAAYGADARRWPEAEREHAARWARDHAELAQGLLADAAGLDAWLDCDRVAAPSRALAQRVVEGAGPAPWRWLRFGWRGAALAGAGLVGGLTGALVVSMFVLASAPVVHPHEPNDLTTAFGPSGAEEAGE